MRQGYIYILHFDTPLHHAEHYAGCTADLRQRLTTHACGQGSRLCEVLMEKGIAWRLGSLATCTLGDMRRLERLLKRQHESGRYCELCAARDGLTPRRLPDTRPMAVELLPWATDSTRLELRGRARSRVAFRLATPDDGPEVMHEVKELMSLDRHSLGFMPVGGSQGAEWSKNNGRLVLAQDATTGQVVGFLIFTVSKANVKIHMTCTRDSHRDCGIGRRMVQTVGGLYPELPLTCHVRDDLPANEFWHRIGFTHMESKKHRTSGSTLHRYERPAGYHALDISIPELIDCEKMPARHR